jgi:hypothetical protein
MPNMTTDFRDWEIGNKPGKILGTTDTKGRAVVAGVARAGHLITVCFGGGQSPDHNDCRCVDFMHYGDQAMRKAIEDFVITNAKALGVNGMITNHGGADDDKPVRVGFPNDGVGGQHYHGPAGEFDTYTGPNHHRDHVHVEFNTDPIGKLTELDGRKPPAKREPAAPKPSAGYPRPTSGQVYLDKLKPGTTNSDSVYYWRMAMNAISFKGGSELKLTGDYTADLVHETKLFQDQRCNDPQDGWPGPKQAALGFNLAKDEMRAKGVDHLAIYKDSKAGGLVERIW